MALNFIYQGGRIAYKHCVIEISSYLHCIVEMYCENDIVDFGVVHYSDAFLAEYLNFTHINRTYQVECDIGYLYAGQQNISCDSQSNILDDPQWAVNISTCGEPLFSCSQ